MQSKQGTAEGGTNAEGRSYFKAVALHTLYMGKYESLAFLLRRVGIGSHVAFVSRLLRLRACTAPVGETKTEQDVTMSNRVDSR